ncbi:hypothetical protein HJG60_007956 [Phyllostomus discolor]|uniref:Uncharacterized protein n=1 Tax=Phyllostomus discolor TaxID=89673 RepID=A0A834BHS4_9CHIR|nr:hypothetical protein HJG60_007956 [Phyllostomus discolor]
MPVTKYSSIACLKTLLKNNWSNVCITMHCNITCSLKAFSFSFIIFLNPGSKATALSCHVSVVSFTLEQFFHLFLFYMKFTFEKASQLARRILFSLMVSHECLRIQHFGRRHHNSMWDVPFIASHLIRRHIMSLSHYCQYKFIT